MEKAAVIGMMAVLLSIPLRKDKPEISNLIILSACILLGLMTIWKLQDIFSSLRKLVSFLGENQIYMKILLKMLGITYIAEFSANLCRDAGSSAVAQQIEFFGKILVLAVSMPILLTLVQIVEKI